MRLLLASRPDGDEGSTATEYALIMFLVAIVVVGAVAFLGVGVTGLFDAAAESVGSLP